MVSRYPLSSAMARFVAQSEALFSPQVIEQGIAAQRRAYDGMAAQFGPPRPASVRVSTRSLSGVAVRCYQPDGTPARGTILFVHGGGWYLGGLDSHDGICAALANDCRLTVVAVAYRLAPEFPFPAGLDDLTEVYQALLDEDPAPPLLVGDSAGGNLIAALTLRCRNRGLPRARGQVLIYPALAAPDSLPSHQSMADAPLLDRAAIDFCRRVYVNPLCLSSAQGGVEIEQDSDWACNPEIVPLAADSLVGLPPATLIASEFDPLVDDARLYCRRLQHDGVAARVEVIDGLVHGALWAIGQAEEADQLYRALCEAVARLTADQQVP